MDAYSSAVDLSSIPTFSKAQARISDTAVGLAEINAGRSLANIQGQEDGDASLTRSRIPPSPSIPLPLILIGGAILYHIAQKSGVSSTKAMTKSAKASTKAVTAAAVLPV